MVYGIDAGVASPFSGTNLPTAKTKQWRIELYFKKPNCGWITVPRSSYICLILTHRDCRQGMALVCCLT
jgi:hypothetical protein